MLKWSQLDGLRDIFLCKFAKNERGGIFPIYLYTLIHILQ